MVNFISYYDLPILELFSVTTFGEVLIPQDLSIFKTQKKIVRIMTFSNYNDDTNPLFQSLKILNIYQLNTYLKAVFKTCIHITTTNFQHSLITFLLPMKPYTLIIHDQCSRYILNLIEQIMVNFL